MFKSGAFAQTLRKCKSMLDVSDTGFNENGVYKNGTEDFHLKRQMNRTLSASSLEMAEGQWHSSGAQLPGAGSRALLVLEHKIDRLSDMFLEQCQLLATLKEDLRQSKAAVEQADQRQADVLADFMRRIVFQSYTKEEESDTSFETNSRARSLLDAIEARQGTSVDREVKQALFNFLNSEELKDHMVAATAESVRNVIGDCISRDVSSLYLPMLEHSHLRFVRQISRTVEDAFRDLEENSACLSRSVYKISRSLRRSIERHQHVLEAATDPQRNFTDTFKRTVEEMLHNELRQWREKVLDVFSTVQSESESEPVLLESAPTSPLQPAPEHSAIDQLMMAAEISQQLEAGAVNAAFERALNAADVALVAAACRRAAVCAPHCRLAQPVLLALLQQLSTDMLHDTHLKCKYLEDSIMNLDVNNEVTRAHLPLVVGEVRKHLSKFLETYPGHMANDRIALIIMAAENLLKR